MNNYFKHGFGLNKEAQSEAASRYQSSLITKMQKDQGSLKVTPFSFHLAREFGFCYGVDKAIDYAYETWLKFPGRRIFITNEIIHNPRVNQDLKELGIQFLGEDVSLVEIETHDIVILPAFGATVCEMDTLKRIGCVLVDTTCGSVVTVWKRVEKYAQDGFTSLIHGKYDHEETRATSSQALASGGHFIIVKDLEETEHVARFIESGEHSGEIMKQFQKALSPGFDPARDLVKIGCANQTTMLKRESLEVAERIRQALVKRYGVNSIDQHFRSFDTVCSATQDRQDAIRELLEKEKLDLLFVIGGFNSSNTSHLAEIAGSKTMTYHISGADDLLSLEEIRFKPLNKKSAEIKKNWLPKDAKSIGLTAGASTPNRVIEEVIGRFLELHHLQIADSR